MSAFVGYAQKSIHHASSLLCVIYISAVFEGKQNVAHILAFERLRGVRHRYPFEGLPIERVLVVIHLCWLPKDKRYHVPVATLFLSARLKTKQGTCLALHPLVSRLRYASKVIQINTIPIPVSR